MANRFPLIVDSVNLNIKELPSGDNLDLTGSDALLGDNDKIILGAGSDLQIFHDGSNSYVQDAGDGALILNTTNGGGVYVYSAGETMATFNSNGAVNLYYDNSPKLATTATGIDVTGTVEFDGLSGTGAVSVTDILDEDSMASNSATALATQQSIKAYVDSQVGANNELSEVLGSGNTTGGTDISVSSGDDITFADSSKAIFGAGSDLSVYHTGSNGFIENDTGLLILKNNSDDRDVAIQSDDGSGGIANYLLADGSTGALNAYHYGSLKLATTATGIDVTGTVTADGATIAGTLELDSNAFTHTALTPNYNMVESDVTGENTQFIQSSGLFRIRTVDDSLANPVERFRIDHSTGDISFFGSVAGQRQLHWDSSADALGIGTVSPSTALEVVGTVTADGLTIDGASAGTVTAATFTNTTSGNGTRVQAVLQNVSSVCGVNLVSERVGANFGADFIVETSDTVDGTDRQRLRVAETGDISFYDSSGTSQSLFWDASAESLGIGTTSPSSSYAVDATAGYRSSAAIPNFTLVETDASNQTWQINSTAAKLSFRDLSRAADRVVIDTAGNVGIGTDSPGSLLELEATSATVFDGTDTDGQAADGTTLAIQNLSDTNDTFSQILFRNRNTSKAVSRIASLTDSTGTEMAFVVENNGSPAEVLRLEKTGNVGIGTSIPDTDLHIKGAGATQIKLEQGNSLNYGLIKQNQTSQLLQLGVGGDFGININSANRVGIGISSPSTALHVVDTTGDMLTLESDSLATSPNIVFKNNDGENARINSVDGGELYFGTGSSGTERMRIDASGNVGIGNSNPSAKIHLDQGASNNGLILDADTAWNSSMYFWNNGSAKWAVRNVGGGADRFSIYSYALASDAVSIDSSGNVGIGTSSPQGLLHVNGFDYSYFPGNVGSATLDNEQGLAIGWNKSSGGGETVLIANQGAGSTGGMVFATNTSAGSYNERMRLDADGNLLVGKTSSGYTTIGAELRDHGTVGGTTAAQVPFFANRTSDDGALFEFYRNTTQVGNIGTVDSDLLIYSVPSGHVGLRFANGGLFPTDNTGTVTNGAADLGGDSFRFKDLYLSGGAYLGGTGGANLLDDYEEGTFTFTLRDAISGGNTSSTTQTGFYTKIGRMVRIELQGAVSNIDTTGMTGGNDLYFDLPFAKGSTEGLGPVMLGSFVFPSGYSYFAAEALSGSVGIIRMGGDNVGARAIRVNEITSGSTDITRLSVTYFT